MPKKKTHEEYVDEILKINPTIEVLGAYINCSTKILHKCKICGYEWMITPNHILRKHGCPKCAGNAKKTHDEYVEEVSKINPKIEVIGKYINSRIKILHRCLIDNYEWMAEPSRILLGDGCPVCGGTKKITHEEYATRMKDVNPTIEVLGKYIFGKVKILHKCKICGHEWMARPDGMLCGHNCPVCSHKIIGNPPEYRNSIWASEFKSYFSKYLTEEQMKMYMPQSSRKISVKCPDCGRQKVITPVALFYRGLCCTCGDGYSYPNKFMYNLLEQLQVQYIHEYSPDWANGKRYDIYIPSSNCIIENNGLQHYKHTGFTNRGLKEEQENDYLKKEISLQNGIEHYIVIDCSKSDVDYIKNSVMNSELPSILNFKKNDINWLKCEEFAMSNLVKVVADLRCQGLTISKISEKTKISAATISIYLRKAKRLNWIN